MGKKEEEKRTRMKQRWDEKETANWLLVGLAWQPVKLLWE